MSEEKEIMRREDRPLALAQDSASVVQAIIRAATDPATDVAKMERMMALAKEIRAEQARAAYDDALARFGALKQTVAQNRTGRTAGGASFSYADWPQMERAIKPWLAECGLSLTHTQAAPIPTPDGTGIAMIMVSAVLSHRDGHRETLGYPAMPNPLIAAKLSPNQAIQQGITYAKRQSAAMILGLSTAEDQHDHDSPPQIVEPDEKGAAALRECGSLGALKATWAKLTAAQRKTLGEIKEQCKRDIEEADREAAANT